MPKPAVHHTHLTACADKQTLLSYTYHDYVYYSEKDEMYWVNKTKQPPAGYMQVNTLRQYSKDSQKFDEGLMEQFLLRPKTPEDHGIWSEFQPKFMLTLALYGYKKNFFEILLKVSLRYIKEMVTVVEYRHVCGMVFDDNGPISVEEELSIF